MLEYSEFQKGREITINFDRICPYSSNTIQNQVCKQKKGLSIVVADQGYDSEDNHILVREKLNEYRIIPSRYENVPV